MAVVLARTTTSTQKRKDFDWDALRLELAAMTTARPTEDTLDIDWELERLGDDSVDLQIEIDSTDRLGDESVDLSREIDSPHGLGEASIDLPREIDRPDGLGEASVDLPIEMDSTDRLGDVSVDFPREMDSPGFLQWAALSGAGYAILTVDILNSVLASTTLTSAIRHHDAFVSHARVNGQFHMYQVRQDEEVWQTKLLRSRWCMVQELWRYWRYTI